MKIKLQMILTLLMVLSAVSAWCLIPTQYMHETRKTKLGDLVPEHFGDWRAEKNGSSVEVPAELLATVNKIYSETVSKTYRNSHGEVVMLSIAYSKEQSDSANVHRPEVCYPAQGFTVVKRQAEQFKVDGHNIPVTQLVTELGERKEPLSYWVSVGNDIVENKFAQKLKQIEYGFKDMIPDGMIFRISTIDVNNENSFRIQKEFAYDFYKSLSPEAKNIFFGVK
ncbi:EpsI family protein [Chitinibacter fontanus]|uniref:EpsI family protein n=1 Tax=Chitinibacter fontanus TaxID=1737446 RepID=A0A7D5ZHQ0_9NEIS|nr:exosortase-associated protein EpsI, B-type [Chitinibacter fontanus]QLI82548.1 EpsI family protein [Chitinibacter fontanus]